MVQVVDLRIGVHGLGLKPERGSFHSSLLAFRCSRLKVGSSLGFKAGIDECCD